MSVNLYPCLFRGPAIGNTGCATCGKATLRVFACAIFPAGCTIKKPSTDSAHQQCRVCDQRKS